MLKASYLNTLSAGTHTVEILWTDGSASTTFTIKADTSDDNDNNQNNNENGDNNINSDDSTLPSDTDKKDDNQQITAPKTGDNSHTVLWISLLGVSLAGLLSMIYVRKKKENE